MNATVLVAVVAIALSTTREEPPSISEIAARHVAAIGGIEHVRALISIAYSGVYRSMPGRRRWSA